MSDFKSGFAIAIFAIVALYFALPFASAFMPPFDADAVNCFPMPSTKGLLPDVKSVLVPQDLAASERHIMETYHAGVKNAEATCTLEACEPEALKNYRSQIGQYVWVRENKTRNFYRERGEDGLALADEVFETVVDNDIIEHLQAMVEAGKFDLGSLGKVRESAALLTAKPAKQYRPCLPADDEP
jgi:hypothetical protein